MKYLINFLKDENGGAIIEYALATAAVSLGLVGAAVAFANRINFKIEAFIQEMLPLN